MFFNAALLLLLLVLGLNFSLGALVDIELLLEVFLLSIGLFKWEHCLEESDQSRDRPC